jgi:hypothetical protein
MKIKKTWAEKMAGGHEVVQKGKRFFVEHFQ